MLPVDNEMLLRNQATVGNGQPQTRHSRARSSPSTKVRDFSNGLTWGNAGQRNNGYHTQISDATEIPQVGGGEDGLMVTCWKKDTGSVPVRQTQPYTPWGYCKLAIITIIIISSCNLFNLTDQRKITNIQYEKLRIITHYYRRRM